MMVPVIMATGGAGEAAAGSRDRVALAVLSAWLAGSAAFALPAQGTVAPGGGLGDLRQGAPAEPARA